MELVAEGWGNHKIAEQLHLSDDRVKNHRFHIFDKPRHLQPGRTGAVRGEQFQAAGGVDFR